MREVYNKGMTRRGHVQAAPVLALAVLAACGAAGCSRDDDPRQAFVGTFAFASSSFETDCSPVPPGHEAIDEVIEVSLGEGDTLEVAIDGETVPCADVAELEAAPRRIGCELAGDSVNYEVEVWIDLSYARPSRMTLMKEFTAPEACGMTFSGLLTAAP